MSKILDLAMPAAAILAAGSAAYFAVAFTAVAKAGVSVFEVAAKTGVGAFEAAADRANTTFGAGVSVFEASTGTANKTFKSLTEGTCEYMKTAVSHMGNFASSPYIVTFAGVILVGFYRFWPSHATMSADTTTEAAGKSFRFFTNFDIG